MEQSRIVKPGVNPNYFVGEKGEMLRPPVGWELLPPGDAAVTKAVKSLGPSWTIQQKRGRKIFSKGVLAPIQNIVQAKELVAQKRKAPGYQRQLENSRRRREEKQQKYSQEFYVAVLAFLNFSANYRSEAEKMAKLVTDHAVPVGSGTVARTETIPIAERAERAVIAWMRHQTTAYDNMRIARVKGRRREVRRELASISRQILAGYRTGNPAVNCPLALVLKD